MATRAISARLNFAKSAGVLNPENPLESEKLKELPTCPSGGRFGLKVRLAPFRFCFKADPAERRDPLGYTIRLAFSRDRTLTCKLMILHGTHKKAV